MGSKLSFQDTGRQCGRIDVDIQLLQEIRQSRHDIVMAVSDEDGFYPVLVFEDITKIRDDIFDPQLFRGIWVLDSTVYNENVFVDLEDIHILTVFAETAESHDTRF